MAAKRHHEHDTLEEIESLGERLAAWVGDHALLSIIVAAGVLIGAAATGGYISYSHHRADAAASALGAVRSEYLEAMGAPPGAVEIPEPANPETARSIRLEFAERFLAVASDHAGTAEAALAHLEAGDLLARSRENDRALEVWQEGLEQSSEPEIRGALLSRIAVAHERAHRFDEAARAHERAADERGYPVAHLERARAAWCWAEAGDTDRALTLYRRVRTDAPDLPIPPHLAARLHELDVATGGSS